MIELEYHGRPNGSASLIRSKPRRSFRGAEFQAIGEDPEKFRAFVGLPVLESPLVNQVNEKIDSTKPRQAQLKIWGFKVGTPPPIAPVPERVTPSYAWRPLVIFALVILLFILLVITANR